jgi:hypothetical protein
MSTGTLVKPSAVNGPSIIGTLDCISSDSPLPDERIMQQLMENKLGKNLFLKSSTTYFADDKYFHEFDAADFLDSLSLPDKETANENIWETPKFRELLNQPLGTSIELTAEEADEIVRLAAGRRTDLTPGKDAVKEIRELFGHSIFNRLKKAE